MKIPFLDLENICKIKRTVAEGRSDGNNSFQMEVEGYCLSGPSYQLLPLRGSVEPSAQRQKVNKVSLFQRVNGSVF